MIICTGAQTVAYSEVGWVGSPIYSRFIPNRFHGLAQWAVVKDSKAGAAL